MTDKNGKPAVTTPTATGTENQPEGPERFLNLYTALHNQWAKHLGGSFDKSFCICPEMWAEVKQYLTATTSVLEFGSGLSTWLIQTQGVKSHIALECSPQFFEAVVSSRFVQDAEVKLRELRSRGLEGHPTYRWERKIGQYFSFVLIDGPVGSVGRNGFLDHLKTDLLSPVFTIVVDDTHRKAERELALEIVHTLGVCGVGSKSQQHGGCGKKFTVIKSELQRE